MLKKLFVTLAFSTSLFATLSADDIVKKADAGRSPEGIFSFHVDVEDRDGGSVQTTGYKVYSKDAVLTLVETLTPQRLKGRKLLMHSTDLWLYLPSIRRPTRVSFQQKLTGEVANGDVARTLFAHDYSATLLGTEKVGKKDCYKLKLTATNKEATYRQIQYWVEKRTFLPVRMQCFAISGKLLKTGDYSVFKKIFNRPRATRLVITDALQPSRRSVLNYSKYKKERLDDAFFSKESLAE